MKRISIKWMSVVLLLLSSNLMGFAQQKILKVVYIGDSITFGAGLKDAAGNPPATASDNLRKLGFDTVLFSNQGHSGYTTVDFLPGSDAFKQAEKAADAYKGKPGLLVFSIMLGTNDSAIAGPNGSPVTPDAYRANLKTIIDRLIRDYPQCKVIIQQPLWYSPNTYNGAQYLQEGLNRLQSYFPQIESLVKDYLSTNKGQVLRGDTKAFAFFKDHYITLYQFEDGHRGIFYLHPNEQGAKALGMFWAEAIYNITLVNQQ